MHREEKEVIGRGEIPIFTRIWHPENPAVGAVVLSHGFAEHSERYEHVAVALVKAGWTVFALDHRGHGRSGGRRALTERLDWLLADLDDVVERASGAPPDARPILVGHSMGGGIAAAYAITHPTKLSALVLSAPAIGLRASLPAPQRLAMEALASFVPSLGTVKLEAAGVSRDPLVVSDYEADPLNYHGKIPARTAREMLRASDLVAARGSELPLPLLIMIGSADRLVPLEGSRELIAALNRPDATMTVYAGLYHEIFNEPERAQVLTDLVAWLGALRPGSING